MPKRACSELNDQPSRVYRCCIDAPLAAHHMHRCGGLQMKRRPSLTPPVTIGLVLSLTCVRSTSPAAADAPTQHYNNARTGANLEETILTTTNVRPNTFGKLWTLFADGQISAQPLFVSGLAVDTTSNTNTPLVTGRFNAVIIATMHNKGDGYGADRENR